MRKTGLTGLDMLQGFFKVSVMAVWSCLICVCMGVYACVCVYCRHIHHELKP